MPLWPQEDRNTLGGPHGPESVLGPRFIPGNYLQVPRITRITRTHMPCDKQAKEVAERRSSCWMLSEVHCRALTLEAPGFPGQDSRSMPGI